MAQGSFLAQITLLRFGPASILLFAEWGLGTRNAQARGQDASLTLHRLAGGAETRIALARRFYLDAKLAPMAYHLRGTIVDSGLDRPLVSRAWTWGLDLLRRRGLLARKDGQGRGSRRLVLAHRRSRLHLRRRGRDELRARAQRRGLAHAWIGVAPTFKPAGAAGRFGLSIGF